MELKTYYGSEEEFDQIHQSLKLVACPHCRKTGCLILHGYLYGYDERSVNRKIARGHRIFCSNRCRRYGCGKTFSILTCQFIRGFMISAIILWRFLEGLASDSTIVKAFRVLNTSFCSSASYRLFRRFDIAQSRIRSLLLRHCSVPEPPLSARPFSATVSHLQKVFPGSICPIAAFQKKFQTSFL